MNTHAMRQKAADSAFERFDFGTSCVVDMEGWESSTGDCAFRRTVYVEPLEGGEGPSERLKFTVEFADGSVLVKSAFALSAKGSLVGHLPGAGVALNQEQLDALGVVEKALVQATDCGLLDELASQVGHPDRVNHFCDDVQTLRRAVGAAGSGQAAAGTAKQQG